MKELRFDGRTAIVTGAGGDPGHGRAFARLLAERGANVVVNDIGAVPEIPTYSGTADPEAVATQIRASGGQAVADGHDVSTDDGAQALVETALSTFGSVDIVINNAALCILAPFDVMTPRHFSRVIETNLLGPACVARAAWPHMKAKGYGRIVNIGANVFGGVSLMGPYVASKGGLFTFTQTLAKEGAAHGIKANTVQPTGYSRMVPALQEESSSLFTYLRDNFPAEATAPLVAFLAHEDCPVSGECFDTAGGHVNRILTAHTAGITDKDQTIETLAGRWDEIMDLTNAAIVEGGGSDSTQWAVRPYSVYANG